MAWYYSFNKVILVPLLNIIILSLLVKLGVISMSYVAIATIAIMMATPQLQPLPLHMQLVLIEKPY